MIPFFRRKKETVSIDWAHRYIIHNLVYSYPDETVTPGDYYAVTQEDFEECLKKAHNAVGKLDLGLSQKSVFAPLVRLHALSLLIDINETRLMHHKSALRTRSEVEAYLARRQARLRLMEERLADLDAEAESLRHVV